MLERRHRLEAQGLQKTYGAAWSSRTCPWRSTAAKSSACSAPTAPARPPRFYMIVGLVRADAGEISIDGEPVEHMPIHRRSRLGLSYLPQEASIFRKLTVEENVRAVLELQRGADGQPLKRGRHRGAAERPAAGPARRPPARFAGAGAVGRRAPPGRDRARAGDAAALHPAGRAVRRHRPDRGDRDPAHHRLPEGARHRRADHRPQRARDAGHLRPRLHHQRRPRAGPGHALPRSSKTPTCAGCTSASTSGCEMDGLTRTALSFRLQSAVAPTRPVAALTACPHSRGRRDEAGACARVCRSISR